MTKGFPIMGFFQNGKIVVPSFAETATAPLPTKLFAWKMLPVDRAPKEIDLKSIGPFEVSLEKKMEREEISTVITVGKWYVPRGSRAAYLYSFAGESLAFAAGSVPVLLFDQSYPLSVDFQKRAVAYTDREFQDELGFREVEKTYQVFWPTLSNERSVWRLMELPNGEGYTYFLNTLTGLECDKTSAFDFYSQQKTQPVSEDEMMTASCGDLSFQ